MKLNKLFSAMLILLVMPSVIPLGGFVLDEQGDFIPQRRLDNLQVNLDWTGQCDARRYMPTGYDLPGLRNFNPAETCGLCPTTTGDGRATVYMAATLADPFNECNDAIGCEGYYFKDSYTPSVMGTQNCYDRQNVVAGTHYCAGSGFRCENQGEACSNNAQDTLLDSAGICKYIAAGQCEGITYAGVSNYNSVFDICANNAHCVNGACACNTNRAACDGDILNGCEVDLLTDDAHCGTCPNACTNNYHCVSGSCCWTQATCTDKGYNCGDWWANPCGGSFNCGACGNSQTCPATGADQGKCTCVVGYQNCDSDNANGCECNTAMNMHCTTGNTCACNAGWSNCDGLITNGCECNTGSHMQCFGANCGCADDTTPPGMINYEDCDGSMSTGCECSRDWNGYTMQINCYDTDSDGSSDDCCYPQSYLPGIKCGNAVDIGCGLTTSLACTRGQSCSDSTYTNGNCACLSGFTDCDGVTDCECNTGQNMHCTIGGGCACNIGTSSCDGYGFEPLGAGMWNGCECTTRCGTGSDAGRCCAATYGDACACGIINCDGNCVSSCASTEVCGVAGTCCVPWPSDPCAVAGVCAGSYTDPCTNTLYTCGASSCSGTTVCGLSGTCCVPWPDNACALAGLCSGSYTDPCTGTVFTCTSSDCGV